MLVASLETAVIDLTEQSKGPAEKTIDACTDARAHMNSERLAVLAAQCRCLREVEGLELTSSSSWSSLLVSFGVRLQLA